MMATEQIKEKVLAIVSEILEVEVEELKDDAHFVKDLGMDSMMALEILASLEKQFKIVIPEEELAQFIDMEKTVATVQKILDKQLGLSALTLSILGELIKNQERVEGFQRIYIIEPTILKNLDSTLPI